MINGLFDLDFRLQKLEREGDPLIQLKTLVPWEEFRPALEDMRAKERKSSAGRKPFDAILMFKILILQSLYNLSDDQMEFQINDRISFMRFLGLDLDAAVPDAKTIWLFREQLTQAALAERLFAQFDDYLRMSGFAARKGQIIDASIVPAPRQRNSRAENEQVKRGEEPEGWSEPKRRQKDVDARWTQKNGRNYYGYKNHVSIDAKHKYIRGWAVTHAAVHDSQVFEELLDPQNTSADVWTDSAYRCEKHLETLKREGYREQMQRKGSRSKPLGEREKQGNRTRSRIRSRVEHVFGVMAQRAWSLLLRGIGLKRAREKIGLRNLAYNLSRYALLAQTG